MENFKKWIYAFRPHTLPLAVSGVGLGNALAVPYTRVSVSLILLSLLTALLLQILSNLANDYGDTKHGTDNNNRIGPVRAVQSGLISAGSMLRSVKFVAAFTILTGVLLLICAYNKIGLLPALVMLVIGLGGIWAAYAYTASDKPYGYSGLGDLFVFIFFGIISVAGTFYLQTGSFDLLILLPAASIGFFSTAVLNLNNLRDIENDRVSNKITIPVRLGFKKARIYHALLIFTGILTFIIYGFINFGFTWKLLFLLPLLSVLFNVYLVFKAETSEQFYPLLKQLSLSIFITVIVFVISSF